MDVSKPLTLKEGPGGPRKVSCATLYVGTSRLQSVVIIVSRNKDLLGAVETLFLGRPGPTFENNDLCLDPAWTLPGPYLDPTWTLSVDPLRSPSGRPLVRDHLQDGGHVPLSASWANVGPPTAGDRLKIASDSRNHARFPCIAPEQKAVGGTPCIKRAL